MAALSKEPIALVTGANRGIGHEIARQLAAKGVRVVMAARKPVAAQDAVEAIVVEGGVAEALVLDVDDSASVAHAAKEFSKRFDRLDVLINNAGVYHDKKNTILTAPRELFASTLNTNAFGPIEVVQQFLPALRKVRTDMGGAEASRSVDEGADTAVWLATEADRSLTGKFFRDRAEIPW